MKFDIPGPPVGKERPRTVIGKDGFSHTYTPQKSTNWGAVIQGFAIQAGARKHYTEDPVAVDIIIERAITKSWSKKRKQAALEFGYASSKPDVDNVSKAILDALNGIAWKDDTQVAKLSVTRFHSERDNTSVEIILLTPGLIDRGG